VAIYFSSAFIIGYKKKDKENKMSKELKERVIKLEDLTKSLKVDAERLEEKPYGTSCTNFRKTCQEIKKMAQDLRIIAMKDSKEARV